MKKAIITLLLSLGTSAWFAASAYVGLFTVSKNEIYGSYFVKKIWLDNYQVPLVTITEASYIETALTVDAILSSPDKVEVQIGMERKRPFALVRIPAFSAGMAGKAQQLSSFKLTLIEDPQTNNKTTAAKPTADVTKSVLSTGTWYKIGVTNTGFHKIDATFIASLGLSPTDVNPANVRIFGSGGRMLPKANYVPRPADLQENAVAVYDDGNNIFDAGDQVIFYGVGPMGWDADAVHKRFTHLKNLYTDTGYYFITFDQGAALRVSEQPATAAGNITVTDYDYYDVHDIDLVNDAGIGATWFGEQFNALAGSLTQTFRFDPGAAISNVYCRVSLGATGPANNSFSVSLNGNNLGTIAYQNGTTESVLMQIREMDWATAFNATSVNIGLTFTPSDSRSIGYLNFVEINARRPLVINTPQLGFRDLQSIGPGNIADYTLQAANSNTRVWDVTDPHIPVLLNGTLNGYNYIFSRDAQTLHEFAVSNGTNFYSPVHAGKVANQNLHGTGQIDDIIVAHRAFLPQAQALAEYHRVHDNLVVVVTTPEEIYNEFSSGAQDICGIRDFVRMFYKRAGPDTSLMPQYLTLFGGASYDYKNRLANNSNFVPVFESAESSDNISAFSTDDFYGFLDDSENIENNGHPNTLDVGVGRLPARTAEDATSLVNKIVNYKGPATLGPWRISSTFVADDNDGGGTFFEDTDEMTRILTNTTRNLYNHSKIYLDAVPAISTPAGKRTPNANATINDRIYKGTMMVNYVGHGNTQVWTDERILTQDDFNKWRNVNMLPFFVTATCDFGQFDHPQYVSAAEQLVLRNGGGAISILTTTAPVFNSYNFPLDTFFLRTQFAQKADGRWHSFGDATRLCKNAAYITLTNPQGLANYRKFALLGDPALTPDFPEHFVRIDSIIDVATSTQSNQIKALGAYRITGSVHDNGGTTLSGFNGIMSVSFYDKPRTVSTISTPNKTFQLQDNLVYKGKVSVTNGRFSYTFIVPKDINYYEGRGKISQYAQNGITDAAGVDTSVTVGGYSDNPVISDVPPIVKPYIGDSLFLNGGITGTNTSLFVALFSETGINVSGNKMGHDLTAVLDNNIEQPYILNDFYETATNTYQRGYIYFPIDGLANGKHTFRVKAWDVNNNVGEGSVDFMVIDGKIVAIEDLKNYPNPFSNETHFVFEHNHPEEALKAEIQICNSTGALVRTIEQHFTPTGSRTNEIVWDGTDHNGNRLPSGMYVYRMMITTEKGLMSSAYQKLVIVR